MFIESQTLNENKTTFGDKIDHDYICPFTLRAHHKRWDSINEGIVSYLRRHYLSTFPFDIKESNLGAKNYKFGSA